MQIELRQPRYLRRAAVCALVRFFMDRAGRLNPRRRWTDLAVTVAGRAAMRRVNRAVFGRETDTDVITLAYAPDPARRGWSGELFVSAALARDRGPRYGGPARELALYLAHGCDHLAGASDDTPARRRRMRARECRWLAAAARAGLVAGLFVPGRDGAP